MNLLAVRRVLGAGTLSVVIALGATACGGSSTSTPTANANAKAVDTYCALVKEALAATKSGDPAKVKAAVPKLQAAYPAALAATKKDPKLVKRFADCAKGNG